MKIPYKLLVPGRPFQSRLMFVGEENPRVELLKGVLLR